MSHQISQNRESFAAKEFEVSQWIDADGNKIQPIKLSDLEGKFKVVFCFQYWCPGCHSKGFPDLCTMVDALKEKNDIICLAIQTVFEGHHENTYDKILETQIQYHLKIPFGHDAGTDGKSISNVMKNYQTGGTPWFIFIDKNSNVVFSDFHLNTEHAVNFLKSV